MTKKKLPIGIQTFSEIISEDYCYVDKTEIISSLVSTTKYCFLSRPRRFGKSLLVSTLKSAFAGEESLFKGLYLEKNWDWSKQYPVISISFGRGIIQSREELDRRIIVRLDEVASAYSVILRNKDVSDRFFELIHGLYQQHNLPVVILIDEYDKPILDNIIDTDTATAIREGLKNFYSVIKDSDEYIKFAFLTGVSKFSKVNLFSGLNNLKDISLSPSTATLCGYTQSEIQDTFSEYLDGVDFAKLKRWYNGYNFLGEKVYNPYDVLLYLDSKSFGNYWSETGNPGFLIDLIQSRQYHVPNLESVTATSKLIGSFDIDNITLEALLFQTGYLTIKEVHQMGDQTFYTLSYPNQEVKMSLNDTILTYLVQAPEMFSETQPRLYKAITSGNPEAFKTVFHAFFASIPHDWYRKNQLANYEGYYASIVYCYFSAMGLDVVAEDSTNTGQIDLTVKTEDMVYIFEFKVVDKPTKANSALAQIKDKKYHEKYQGATGQRYEKVFLMGIEFDKNERNIVQFDWEEVSS